MSEEIKNNQNNQRGGFRKNAGRKPSTVKGFVKKLPRDTATLILAEINAQSKWVELSKSKDERIRLEVLKYLTDRAFGRAKQKIEHSGDDGGPIQSCIQVTFV